MITFLNQAGVIKYKDLKGKKLFYKGEKLGRKKFGRMLYIPKVKEEIKDMLEEGYNV